MARHRRPLAGRHRATGRAAWRSGAHRRDTPTRRRVGVVASLAVGASIALTASLVDLTGPASRLPAAVPTRPGVVDTDPAQPAILAPTADGTDPVAWRPVAYTPTTGDPTWTISPPPPAPQAISSASWAPPSAAWPRDSAAPPPTSPPPPPAPEPTGTRSGSNSPPQPQQPVESLSYSTLSMSLALSTESAPTSGGSTLTLRATTSESSGSPRLSSTISAEAARVSLSVDTPRTVPPTPVQPATTDVPAAPPADVVDTVGALVDTVLPTTTKETP